VAERTTAADPGAAFTPVRLQLVGADHPGIVREISRALHEHGVNIEELNTECVAAPMSGETLFRASAKLRLPGGLTIDELRARLEDLAHSLMVDLQLVERREEPGEG
jgi:glycine cleavage system regulatory protein